MARRGQKGADTVSILGPGRLLQGFVLFVIIHQARQNNACLCFYVCVAYINQSCFLFFFLNYYFVSIDVPGNLYLQQDFGDGNKAPHCISNWKSW